MLQQQTVQINFFPVPCREIICASSVPRSLLTCNWEAYRECSYMQAVVLATLHSLLGDAELIQDATTQRLKTQRF
jgi:hypothetical protein